MQEDELTTWAARVLDDFDNRQPWRSFVPPAGFSLEQAYGLQSEVARLREERGERVVGYKVGCTSRTIQDQLGIREPIFGRIFDTGCVPARSRLAHSRFVNPAIEGELALRLAYDLPCEPGLLTDSACSEAIATVFPVIELHNYVLPVPAALAASAAAALIVSGGMHAGVVLPDHETPFSATTCSVDGLDVAIDGRIVGTTEAPWTMASPAATLRWLATRLAVSGLPLHRGQIILTGSALPLFPVEPGEEIVVRTVRQAGIRLRSNDQWPSSPCSNGALACPTMILRWLDISARRTEARS